MLLLLSALLPALATGDAAPGGAIKLPPPGVEYRVTEASASRTPWIDANGWRIQRAPDRTYFYEVRENAAALACAEAFAYGAHASVHSAGAGAAAFNRMLDFLKSVPDADYPVMANIGVLDDGSPETGELMNLLERHNLLFRVLKKADSHLDLNVQLGSGDYPRAEAANPDFLARKIRAELGDDKRLVRLYGSEVVIARLTGSGDHARLQLLNYAARPVSGLRVRVLGSWANSRMMAYDRPQVKLQDVAVADGATEFTILEMSTYAVIDLSR